MKLPAHARYKPSGVEWLGDVPEHWGVKRLKYLTEISTSGVWGEDPDSEDDGCPVATTANISPQGEIDVPGMHRRLLSKEELRKGLCRPGDTIVVKSSGSASSVISGKCAMVRPEHGEICFSNFTLRVRPIEGRLDPFFTWSFLSSGIVRAQVRLMVSTTTYPNLQVPEYISFLVPQPPPAEQRAIAAFLDRETGRVDRLVAKKRELIERLKEKRTALISRTVTRGLPSAAARAAGLPANPPLKPSGLDWLGDIPKHWEALTVRRRAKRIQTGGTPPTAEERYYEDGTVPWFGPGSFDDQIVVSQPIKLLNASAVKEGAARMFAAGATMVVTIGATLGKVSSLTEAGSCNQQITVIEFDQRRIHPRFATYQLKRLEPALRAIAPSATLPILDQGEIADIALGVPPLPEQAAIAAYLDEETAKLDALVEKVEEAVERLQEYRTALITAAVTGKIDVRKEVAA